MSCASHLGNIEHCEYSSQFAVDLVVRCLLAHVADCLWVCSSRSCKSAASASESVAQAASALEVVLAAMLQVLALVLRPEPDIARCRFRLSSPSTVFQGKGTWTRLLPRGSSGTRLTAQCTHKRNMLVLLQNAPLSRNGDVREMSRKWMFDDQGKCPKNFFFLKKGR